MEYVYSALLLHAADNEISEEGVTDVLEAAGVEIDEARVKALVSALDGVDIEDAIEGAAVSAAAAPAGGAAADEAAGDADEAPEEAEEEEEEEEEEVSEEEAAAGLGELF